jgi:uncharacterized protein
MNPITRIEARLPFPQTTICYEKRLFPKRFLMRLAALYRYPVKGLSPERLPGVTLTAGQYFPGDRMFAIENGPAGFDPANPEHQPKIKFLMLMRHEALAGLKTHYIDETGELVINLEGREVARGNLATGEGRAAITTFIKSFMPESLRGEPQVLDAPDGFRFTDSRSGFVSLINLASVADLAKKMDAAIDPLRFRGNLHVEGLAPWQEFDLVGKMLEGPSGLRLEVIKRIERCAATGVDPETGKRDLPIVRALMQAYDHFDCGIYCRIIAGGTLAEGEQLGVATF